MVAPDKQNLDMQQLFLEVVDCGLAFLRVSSENSKLYLNVFSKTVSEN